MIVAMVPMRVMKPTLHKVIDMVTMRHDFVSALWAMLMPTMHIRRASIRSSGRNFNNVFVHLVAFDMVQMPLVKIIHMTIMPHCNMTATRPMSMNMMAIMLRFAVCHSSTSLREDEF